MSLGFAPSGVGFYGKIPVRGDFVGAGLPRDLVNRWDGWCRLALHESRQALGESWLAAWMEAPIWRFRLAPGLCGAAGILGVMLPSVDRAGRHFP
ncbi:MAG: type VI secretion-associated protein, partial [Acidiphilium sp. 21-62-4]